MPKFAAQIDAQKIPIKGLVAEQSATAPASPVNGQEWYDTSVNKLKVYENGQWVTYMNSATTLDAIPAPANNVAMNNKKITGLATPTTGTDAATKQYVDDAVQGLSGKDSVRAATTANITLSGTQTVDTVALAVGDRVLVKDQTTASQNGIYIVASGTWTRALDFDTTAEIQKGAYFFVEEGSQGDSGWILTTDGAITIGTTALAFTQFSGAGQITAGNGIAKSGNTLSVQPGNATIVVDATGVRVGDLSGVTMPTINIDTGTAGTLPISRGGTGQTTIAGVQNVLAIPTKKSWSCTTQAAGAWVTYTMPAGTYAYNNTFQVFDTNGGAGPYTEIEVDIRLALNGTTFDVKTDVAYAADGFVIIAVGR